MQIALSTLNQNIGVGFFVWLIISRALKRQWRKYFLQCLWFLDIGKFWHFLLAVIGRKWFLGLSPTSAFSPRKAHIGAAHWFWDQCVRLFVCLHKHARFLLLSQVYLMVFTKLQMSLIQDWYNSKPTKITCWLSTVCVSDQMTIWLVRFQIPGTAHLVGLRINFISQTT